MLRDRNLVPLSHQHQHVLALCVRIGRDFASVHDTPHVHAWEEAIVRLYDEEMAHHFRAEEKHIFPAASEHEELQQLVDELMIEHTLIRKNVERARARQFTVTDLQVFTAMLSQHIRKEERHLFETMQQLLTSDELSSIGAAVAAYFQSCGVNGLSCGLPAPTPSDEP